MKLAVLALGVIAAEAFTTISRAPARTVIRAAIPTDVQGTVSGVRQGLQATLNARSSRIAIDLPPGSSLNVQGEDASVTQGAAALERGDREVCVCVCVFAASISPLLFAPVSSIRFAARSSRGS